MNDNGEPFLETAHAIGKRLCRDALWSGACCNWLGWSTEEQNGKWIPAFKSCTADIYEGTAGVTLFLAHLFRLTEDPHIARTLAGAARHAIERVDRFKADVQIGFYSGSCGVAYAAVQAGLALQDDKLLRRGADAMLNLRELALDATMIDIISGCAGAIPALMDTAAQCQRPELNELAIAYGEHLLQCAHQSDRGMSWDTVQTPNQPHLLGYAHGAAGVATSLLEVYRLSGDDRFRQAALGGLQYERSYFDQRHGNWPDLRLRSRQSDGSTNILNAWCHGAPGIGMSRARCYSILDGDTEIRDEIERAIAATRPTVDRPVSPGRGNYSLCHGSFGNAELMIQASQTLEKPELFELAKQAGRFGIEYVEQAGLAWPCGAQNTVENPCFMIGLAGIGFYYLRLHDPQTVPSVLVLTPRNPP